jgi:glycosyltransferase involved in cell wall biosynthesis
MHVLFIHQAFPAQFGRLGLELSRRYGWQCSFLVQHLSKCPSPSREMLDRLTIVGVPRERQSAEPLPWPENFGDHMKLSARIHGAARARPDLKPDLVVAHCGLGPSLFLRDVFRCPFVSYFEYYLAARFRDLTYRVDLPPVEPAPFYPRCINAATLLSAVDCPAGYTPTNWQRQSFPERFRPRIEVHFDGLDTDLYRPGPSPEGALTKLLGGRTLPTATRLVTFAARGLESMRGFDVFLRVAARLSREYSDLLFAVAGDEEVYYGWDRLFTGGASFKQWALERSDVDPARLLFLGHVEPEDLAVLLRCSNLHLYLSVPFVLSWSLLNAMACGCVVLASDVEPVREVIVPGVTGLLEPLFDVERLSATALRVLRDPAAFEPLGREARALMETRYSLDVAVPALKDYFERMRDEG